jgi:hypothetical protein
MACGEVIVCARHFAYRLLPCTGFFLVQASSFLRKTVAENYGRRSQIAKNLGKSVILAC